MNKRIALVGASSTGKTTVYNLLKEHLPTYRFVNESTRTVAEYGFPINEQGTDATQLAISSFHLQALLDPAYTVFDRSYMDLVVYTSLLKEVSEHTFNFINSIYEQVKYSYTHYIYFPIEFDAVVDGVRSVDEDWRQSVDQEFYENLKELNIPYLQVTGTPKDRVSQILNFIKTK
jgi:nicotinamide riboside kinase